MEELITKVQEWLALYGLKAIGALVILILAWPVAALITRAVKGLMRRTKVDDALVGFLGSLLEVLLKTIVVVAVLDQLGFETTSIIALLGAASLAVAMALQGQLSNLAAGVLLFVFRPFRVGDFVEAAGVLGTVEQISMMNTTFKVPAGTVTILPNSQVFSGKIQNFSIKPIRRVDLVIGVSYDDDLRKAKEVIAAEVEADERVLKDPAPWYAVVELGESSVNIAARPWVAADDWWQTYCDLLEKIKLRLDAEGVTIPYPQRDVHLHQAQPAAADKE